MIPIVENHISITPAFFQEWLKSNETPSYKKTFRIFSTILIVLFVAVFGFFVYLGNPPVILFGEAAFMLGLYLWVIVLIPKNKKKSKYKALCKGSNDVPKRTIRFYQDHLSVTTDSGKLREFPYEKIMKFRETENLYVLIDESGLGIVLDKNGFTKGTAEQMKELLSENCTAE